MNAELREAVESLDQSLEYAIQPTEKNWHIVRQALRDQEAEIARLVSESSQHFVRAREWAQRSGQQEARAEKAEALLRECLTTAHWPTMADRITAHLGGEHD